MSLIFGNVVSQQNNERMNTSILSLSMDVVQGQGLLPHVNTLAEMRINLFKNFPYLYAGSLNEREIGYVKRFAQNEHALLGIAQIENTVAGMLTGIPLVCDLEIVAHADSIFAAAGLNAHEYYYFGDALVLQQFRNLGIARALFAVLEAKVKSLGYKKACFLVEDGDEHHPMRPENFKQGLLWSKLGYKKTSILATMSWPTIQVNGAVQECNHTLTFWIKDL